MVLRERYEAIEAKTAAFSRETGVGCPPGCGECCEGIDFLVSRPEAERVAEFLLDHPALLERFRAQPIAESGKAPCPLYDAANPAAHCTVYEARPLLCRTFAFAAHRDKSGALTYAPCHRFREDAALAAKLPAASDAVRAGRVALPILPDESMTVWALDPGGEALPMGPAIVRALDRLELRRGYLG